MARFDLKTALEKLAEMIAQHDDVAMGCDAECMFRRLASAPWLAGLAGYNDLDLETVLKANVCFDFQWGIEAARLNGHPPTAEDWNSSYYDRANAFADRLGCFKPFDKPANRLRLEYGGPF